MHSKILIAIFTLLLFSGSSHAYTGITIEGRWPDDNNITNFSDPPAIFTIQENYNEDELIPYPSHDGNAIVDITPEGDIHFFDSIITYDPDSVGGQWQFEFEVKNSTPWDWSDYHFEFFNGAFNSPLDFALSGALYSWSNDVVFQNSELVSNSLSFWEPSKHISGATHTYRLGLDFDIIADMIEPQNGSISFGIRQIATTVPEPNSLALMIIGLIGLRRKYV